MNRALVILVGTCLLLAGKLQAQQASKELTPDELYAIADRALRLSGDSAWRLEFSKVPKKTIAYQPLQVESVRNGERQRDVIQWNNGKTTESWWLGRDVLAQSPIVDGMIYGENRWPKDRIGLAAWVARENLKGLETENGKKVIVFEAHLALQESSPGFFAPDTGPEAGPGLTLAAYILLEEPRLTKVTIDGSPVTVTWLPSSILPDVPEVFLLQKAKLDKRRERLGKNGPNRG